MARYTTRKKRSKETSTQAESRAPEASSAAAVEPRGKEESPNRLLLLLFGVPVAVLALAVGLRLAGITG